MFYSTAQMKCHFVGLLFQMRYKYTVDVLVVFCVCVSVQEITTYEIP